MSVVRQIRVVLWKNFTIRRRRWVCSIVGDRAMIDIFASLAPSDFRADLAPVSLSHSRLDPNEKSDVLLRCM